MTYPEIVLFGIFLSLYATLKTDIPNLPTNFILLLRTRVHAWNQTRSHQGQAHELIIQTLVFGLGTSFMDLGLFGDQGYQLTDS